MQLVDYDTFLNLLKESSQQPVSSIGGCTLNTLRGLASLGHSCALFGKIGQDQHGERLRAHLSELNIRSHLISVDQPTAQVACLVTSDSERTMCSFLGAGAYLKPEELSPQLFAGVKLVHIEGYLFACQGVVQRAMELAKQAGAVLSFDLANFEIVSKYKSEISQLLSKHVDIVFANAQESFKLTGLQPKESCLLLKDLTEIAIVKMGEQGGWVADAQQQLFYPAVNVHAVDTTGAGDFFASGFLHGYLKNKELLECARNGAWIASEVVKVIGTEIPPKKWEEIRNAI